jgi:hypothetical protein
MMLTCALHATYTAEGMRMSQDIVLGFKSDTPLFLQTGIAARFGRCFYKARALRSLNRL